MSIEAKKKFVFSRLSKKMTLNNIRNDEYFMTWGGDSVKKYVYFVGSESSQTKYNLNLFKQ
jgi:hypothetical protein